MLSDEYPLEQKLKEARKRLKHVGATLQSVERLAKTACMEEALHEAFWLAHQGERLALHLRGIPALTGIPHVLPTLEEMVPAIMDIWVGRTAEGWLYVSFPRLLPRKEHGSPEFIRRGLYWALQKYFWDHEAPRIDNCVLVIRHVYDERLPERRWRDHDNIEVNAVIDAVAFFALRDDAPSACFHFYCSVAGKADSTQLFIVPKAEFSRWYAYAEQGEYPIVLLHGNGFETPILDM